jgi:hypothetical protein
VCEKLKKGSRTKTNNPETTMRKVVKRECRKKARVEVKKDERKAKGLKRDTEKRISKGRKPKDYESREEDSVN